MKNREGRNNLKRKKDDLDNEISKMQPEELLIATIDNRIKEITKKNKH